MVYDIHGNVISDGGGSTFVNPVSDNPFLIQLTTQDAGVMQGACTDGENLYYCIYDENTLYKYNVRTGAKTSHVYSSGLYDHANDMTYNPNTDKIYVATMSNGVIRIVNPSTLEDEGSFTPKKNGSTVSSSGIAYDRKNNKYILTSGNNYNIFDSEWNWLKSFTYNLSQWTYEGVETDGNYIYRILWNGSTVNKIALLDMNGSHVKTITVPSDDELEALCNDWNGNWYAAINIVQGGSSLHYIGMETYATLYAANTMDNLA